MNPLNRLFKRKLTQPLAAPTSRAEQLAEFIEHQLTQLRAHAAESSGTYLAVTGNYQFYLTKDLTWKPFNWFAGVPSDAALLEYNYIRQELPGEKPNVWRLEPPAGESIGQTHAIHVGRLYALLQP